MPAGRPPKYETPEEMQRIIDLYYIACKLNSTESEVPEGLTEEEAHTIQHIDDVVPTISGLAYTLGMSTEALRNYEQKDEFLATVKKAKQRVEMSLEQRLAGTAVTGSIFSLKNNFGWKDKIDTTVGNPDGTNLESGSSDVQIARKLALVLSNALKDKAKESE